MNSLPELSKLIRYYSLVSTTEAGSGHPTSSMSATDLMTVLFFNENFRYEIENPKNPNNDRLIFSKGHASPLFYSLWLAAGGIDEKEIMTLRKFGSRLEGHPTMEFPFTEAPTGSLGQGLSIGLGIALNAKYLDKLPYRTFVLLGDSEMAEGSNWEAMNLASHYKLDNLIGIIDVNRLGQRGETLFGHHTEAYESRCQAFGWHTIVIDGHNFEEIQKAYDEAFTIVDRPTMIIAKTLKGKGVSFLEDKNGWHGTAVKKEELGKALEELGEVDLSVRGTLAKSEIRNQKSERLEGKGEKSELRQTINDKRQTFLYDKPTSTRKAYGNALMHLANAYPDLVVLDAEVSNSTYAEKMKDEHAERFFEMYIAEQNMVGTAIGLSTREKIPFVSTFAAFFTRAYDQIRMSQYSHSNIKFVGSHAGVSIGADGASQMALEDIAMFRPVIDCIILYPSDAYSLERLVEEATKHYGNVYIRTTRADTPILYSPEETFPIGGSKTLRSSKDDQVTLVAAGITLHEALKAYDILQKEGIHIRVIDLYSIKPIDQSTLEKAAKETKAIITVEDHSTEGGLGDAVLSALSETGTKVHKLGVTKIPHSGTPEELLKYEEIDAEAIVKAVRKFY